jgi:hypothetical protein
MQQWVSEPGSMGELYDHAEVCGWLRGAMLMCRTCGQAGGMKQHPGTLAECQALLLK